MSTLSSAIKASILGMTGFSLSAIGFVYMLISEHNVIGIFFGILGILSIFIVWKEIISKPRPFYEEVEYE